MGEQGQTQFAREEESTASFQVPARLQAGTQEVPCQAALSFLGEGPQPLHTQVHPTSGDGGVRGGMLHAAPDLDVFLSSAGPLLCSYVVGMRQACPYLSAWP